MYKHKEVVIALLEAGADPNTKIKVIVVATVYLLYHG
jgi:hypothetical protein